MAAGTARAGGGLLAACPVRPLSVSSRPSRTAESPLTSACLPCPPAASRSPRKRTIVPLIVSVLSPIEIISQCPPPCSPQAGLRAVGGEGRQRADRRARVIGAHDGPGRRRVAGLRDALGRVRERRADQHVPQAQEVEARCLGGGEGQEGDARDAADGSPL